MIPPGHIFALFALRRGTYVIVVQPAIELYSKLGIRGNVLHVDIAVGPNSDTFAGR